MEPLGPQLRRHRESLHLTQAQVALHLGVTQQAMARWEAGASEPPLKALRLLASLYVVSLDALLGVSHVFTISPTRRANWLASLDRATARQWGYFGVRMPLGTKTAWFPISAWAAADFTAAQARDRAWAALPALNNRILLLNMRAPIMVYMIESSTLAARFDWRPPWDADLDLSLADYRALYEKRFATGSAFAGFGDGVRKALAGTMAWQKLVGIVQSRVALASGEVIERQANGACLVKAVSEADADRLRLLQLTGGAGLHETFLPAAAVHFADLPTIRVLEHWSEDPHPLSTPDS